MGAEKWGSVRSTRLSLCCLPLVQPSGFSGIEPSVSLREVRIGFGVYCCIATLRRHQRWRVWIYRAGISQTETGSHLSLGPDGKTERRWPFLCWLVAQIDEWDCQVVR